MIHTFSILANRNLVLKVLSLLCLVSLPAQAKEPLSYGVQPFIPPIQLDRTYGPLIDGLSKHLDEPVQFRTRRSVQEYQNAVNAGEFDIVLVNPFEYVALRNNSPYRGLVQRKGEIKGIFYVIDKEIDNLEALRGKAIGFPSENSAISIIGLRKLRHSKLLDNDYQSWFFNEHTSCKQALANGRVSACLSSPQFNSNGTQDFNKKYIPIASTDGIPSSVIMIHERRRELEEKIREWFLSLSTTEQGLTLLRKTFLNELETIDDHRYDQLEIN